MNQIPTQTCPAPDGSTKSQFFFILTLSGFVKICDLILLIMLNPASMPLKTGSNLLTRVDRGYACVIFI